MDRDYQNNTKEEEEEEEEETNPICISISKLRGRRKLTAPRYGRCKENQFRGMTRIQRRVCLKRILRSHLNVQRRKRVMRRVQHEKKAYRREQCRHLIETENASLRPVSKVAVFLQSKTKKVNEEKEIKHVKKIQRPQRAPPFPVFVPDYLEITKRQWERLTARQRRTALKTKIEDYWDRKNAHAQVHLGSLFTTHLKIHELVMLCHDYLYAAPFPVPDYTLLLQ